MPFWALEKKGRFHERNQYFLRAVYRVFDNPADALDPQGDTAIGRVSITTDVPILRIDHVTLKGRMPGVWQAFYTGDVFDLKEMNRRFVHVTPKGCKQ